MIPQILLVSAVLASAPLGPEGVCTPARPAYSGQEILTGPMTGRPVLADMNRDGVLDIVVACGTCCGSPASPDSGHVLVFLNNGKGQFRESADERLKVGPSVRKIAVADVNSDKVPDVLAAEHDSYDLTVLLNNGDGVLRRGAAFTAAAGRKAHTHDVITADLNGDGFIDAASTNANDHTVSVLLGDGRGAFAPAPGSPFLAGRHPYDAIGAADFNGDGRIDLAIPMLMERKLAVLFSDSAGAFARGAAFEVHERPGYLAVGDVNGDGKADIVGTHDDEGIIDVLLADGAGGFTPAAGSPHRLDAPAWGIAIADMNGDRRPDLAIGVAAGTRIRVALGDGKGGFDTRSPIIADAGKLPMYVAAGDLNGDGKADVVTGNYGAGSMTVLLAR